MQKNRVGSLTFFACTGILLVTCGGVSGPTADVVDSQVKKCLGNLQPTPNATKFSDLFEVQQLVVEDRLVKEKEAQIVVNLTLTAKEGYGVGIFDDNPLYYRELVPDPAEAGEVVAITHTFPFELYEQGWRIVC